MVRFKSFEIHKKSELSDVVHFLIPHLGPETLLLLDGPMASGKTTLISQLLAQLGVSEVSSPTYALHHQYKTNSYDIHHFDLHRLKSAEDIDSSGFWDFFSESQSLFIVEWSNYVPPNDWPFNLRQIHIQIEKLDQENRKIQIEFKSV